jgi:nucleoside-diphosphate-sugar epimerase
MIIGGGLLASCLKIHLSECNSNILYFASGVSKSSELNAFEFQREVDLLSKYLCSSYYIVYFSTCSVYDKELITSPYVRHKLNIENILRARGNSLVVRVPQVVGPGGNKHTLINYLYHNIFFGKTFDIWANAKRSLIDVEDVVYFTQKLVEYCVPDFCVVNVSAPFSISVIDLVKLIEKNFGLTACYNLIDAGSSYSIDVTLIESLFDNYTAIFDQDYFESLVIKYCDPKSLNP